MISYEHLQEIMAKLPTHLQEDVVSYAEYLLQRNVPESERRPRFYICPMCFSASTVQRECHGRQMISCDAENPEDCMPPMAADGELKARAPRWFIVSIAP